MNGTDLQLCDLQAFLAVVDTGSLTAAAEQIGVPKSSVSRRITRLEDTIGARLLRRHPHHVELTELGSTMVDRARQLLSDAGSFTAIASGTGEVARGRLRVSAALDLSVDENFWVDFAASYRQVRLEVEFSNRYVDLIREGFDVALRGGPGDDPNVIGRKLGSYLLQAVASPDYLAKHSPLKEPKDLRTHDCILMRPFSRSNAMEEGAQRARHLVVTDVHLAVAAARRGLGIAIVPPAFVAEDLATGKLAVALSAYDPLIVPLFGVYDSRRYPSGALQAFLSFAESRFRRAK